MNAKLDFGAVGNDSADDTLALDNAVAASITQGRPLWIPAGTYRRTTPLDLRSHGLHAHGAGTYNSAAYGTSTIIKQMTDNTPVVRLGRSHQHITGMLATYGDSVIPTSSDTSSNGFEFYKAYNCRYEDLEAYRVGRGFYCPPGDYDDGVSATGNGYYSCEFNSMHVTGFAISAIDLVVYGATGSVWNNTYISNNPTGTRQNPSASTVKILGAEEMVFNQLNIEWQLMQSAFASQWLLYFESCGNIVINALHLEQISLEATDSTLMQVADGTKLQVNGMNLVFSSVANAGNHAFCNTFGDAFFEVDGFDQHDNTVAGTFAFLNAGGATAGVSQAHLQNADTSLFSALVLNEKAAPQQMLREVNGNRYAWQEGGCNVTTGTAAPGAGAWLRGDRCWNTTPSAAGVPGWVCTAAGSPGTWKAMAAVAA